MSKKSNNTFRMGDNVEIILPWFVNRVGYPKCINDYLLEAEEKFKDHLDVICKIDDNTNLRSKLLREIAYTLAKANHFGGKVRSLHITERPKYLGYKTTIYSLRSVVTGIYYPPFYSRSYYDYDDEYEPGGLYDTKRHRLAKVNCDFEVLEIPTTCLRKII